jgi:hypothetical protein
MKKNFIFLLLLVIISLGAAPSVLAGSITLTNPLTGVDTFQQLFTKITVFTSEVIGALAVLMLVIAAIFFVTAGAKPENISTAKKIAIYAIVGLAIALAASGLVAVINAVIGAPPPPASAP